MFITLYKLESLYNTLALGRLRSISYCILVQNIPLSILGVIDNVEWTIMWWNSCTMVFRLSGLLRNTTNDAVVAEIGG